MDTSTLSLIHMQLQKYKSVVCFLLEFKKDNMGMENSQCTIIPREKQRGKEAGTEQRMND